MLSASSWSSNLLTEFSTIGYTGSSLQELCDGIGNGRVDHLTGKSFTTTDTGTLGGAGNGSGIGLTVSNTTISSNIYQEMLSLGYTGTNLLDLCDAIANADSSQLSSVTLTSTHSPILSGTGVIVSSSIPLVDSSHSIAIQTNTLTFSGVNFPDFCDAIASGFNKSVKDTAVGQVTITIASGIPTSPGSGVGSGSIT